MPGMRAVQSRLMKVESADIQGVLSLHMETELALRLPQGKGRGLGHHCTWNLPLRNAAGPGAGQLDIVAL